MWDNESGYSGGEIPSEWTHMEKCLYTFIYDQFDIHKLSPITNYLQMLMHDMILLAQLNIAIIAPKVDDMTRKIRQLQDSISRLKDKHDKAYMKVKNKVNVTISDVRSYVLWTMNGLRENPEKLVSKEMISRINSKITEAELYILLQERWK
jgi:hypothetical protein